MKAAAFWLLIPVSASILLYNACSQFQPATPTNAAEALYCRMMVENNGGKVTRAKSLSSPFVQRKVILPSAAKDTAVPKGSPLSVILDNNCLKGSAVRSDFIAGIIAKSNPHPRFARQAYSYTVPSDTTESQLGALAANEPCLVGASWERTYRVQQAGMTFSDPQLPFQNHLGAINALIADALFYAPPYGMAPTGGGTPVIVAVLDTGVDSTHPDLQANLWQSSSGYGVDATTIGGTVSFDSTDIASDGHGTHVAGIIAAVSNNGIGIVGTMPFGAQVMPIKIFQPDSNGDGGVNTTTTWFFNGMQFAVQNGANVINLSLASSGTEYDSVALSGIQMALAENIPVIVAMGNGTPMGQLVDNVNVSVVPAIYSTMDGVIGVASFDANTGNISDFSNYSTTYAEIAAPGALSVSSGILSTIPIAMSSYGQLSGTSQATAMVSAAAALAIGWIEAAYGTAPTAAEVERLIESSSASNPNLAYYVKNSRQLDLYGLANTIMAEYPRTVGQGSTTLPAPFNCD